MTKAVVHHENHLQPKTDPAQMLLQKGLKLGLHHVKPQA